MLGLDPLLTTLFCAAVGAIPLGLLALLFLRGEPGRGFTRRACAVTLLLAAIALGLALASVPAPIWAGVATLAGICLLGQMLRSEWTPRLTMGLLKGLGQFKVQALVLIVAGLGGVVACATRLEESGEALFEMPEEMAPPPLVELPQLAFTDAGTELPVFQPEPGSKTLPTPREEVCLTRMGLAFRAIRTGPGAVETNCHGWVFADGRYWVKGGQVDLILRENGYLRVHEPQPDDVAVYRDEQGTPTHSALVRSVTGGRVLLESKWGQMGRFLHSPTDQPYGERFEYYRSSRKGHTLKGLEKYGPTPGSNSGA